MHSIAKPGSTGVTQAMGMETLLNAGFMRESRQERADRLFRLVDSRERNDPSAVHYTPFSCVLLHCCAFSYDYGIAKGAQNPRTI
jgi:hypothetical protein